MTSSSGIISQLIGKWQQVSSDNFDAFLAAAGKNYCCIVACMSVLTSQRTDVQSAVQGIGTSKQTLFQTLKKGERQFLHCYSINYIRVLKIIHICYLRGFMA